MEDTRLTKVADLAAKQRVLLASDVPDAWKRPQLKAVGRQLRHWTKKVRQPFDAPVSGVRATGAPASPEGPFRPGRKPPVPPRPSITPSAKKKLQFKPKVSTEELAKELPFLEAYAPKPWNTPSLDVKRQIRQKAAAVAKKKGKSLAKKALEWKTWKTP